MKRQKLVDLESTQGLADFAHMADKASTRARASGMGHRSDASLLKAIAGRLAFPKEQAQEGEYLPASQDDLNAAAELRKYARAPSLAWLGSRDVLVILRKLAKKGDAAALELIARTQKDRGLYDPEAEADLYALHAKEYDTDAFEYDRAGNADAAKLAKEVARLSRLLADVLRGEHDFRPRKQAKAKDRRFSKPDKILREYETATIGMTRLSPDERAVMDRLAAKYGTDRGALALVIKRASERRDRTLTGGTVKRARD